MNFLKNKILIGLIILLLTTSVSARKPFRVGIKAGFPNVASLNAELVLPILGGRIAAMVDYSDLSITVDNIKSDFTYFEPGVNLYFYPDGKWLYASVSYVNMKTNLTLSDLTSETSPTLTDGVATTEVKINSPAIKIGAKIGGFFYIRPEVGYLFTPLGKEIDVTATFPGDITETVTEELPQIIATSFIFSFGFGFAF